MEKILKKYVLLSVWSVETECSSTAVRWGAAEILGQVLPVRRVEQECNRFFDIEYFRLIASYR